MDINYTEFERTRQVFFSDVSVFVAVHTGKSIHHVHYVVDGETVCEMVSKVSYSSCVQDVITALTLIS